MKVLFVVPYPHAAAPSQRFRYEHFLNELEENNIRFRVSSFWNRKTWSILYLSGRRVIKVSGLILGLAKRFFLLFSAPQYDFIFIHREATPIGPPWFEWIIHKIFRRKIIFDFDDAIWIPAVSKNNTAAKKFRNFGKTAHICRWANKVCTGNSFLANYAKQFNTQVYIIPTVVNTEQSHNRLQVQQSVRPAVGWTGTFSTLEYLNMIVPVLQQVQEKIDFTFFVIADKDPKLPLKNYCFVPWEKDTEIEDLLRFHIGLMPLTDSDISRGKCGFKAIQYMALGIPVLLSPVGVNKEIVQDGINGYLCSSSEEWENRLTQLLLHAAVRTEMGIAARKRIEEAYSVSAVREQFLRLFS